MNSLILQHDTTNLVSVYGQTYTNAITKYFKHNETLDFDSIVKYLNDCKSKYSNSTIALYKSALKKYIKNSVFDLNQRAILDTAFNDIKITKSKSVITDSKIVSKDTVKSMIAKSNIKDGLIIETLFTSGMRVSELINIELKNCKVICTENIKYININIVGKGNKERIITMSIDLFEKIKATFQSKVYLFETRNHTKYIRTNIYTIINNAGKRVLGTKQVPPHTLRHSFATHLLIKEKQSIKAVSSYLGHSSTAITSDFYIHDNLAPKKIINMM